jgi:hypothetical protein
MPHGTDAMGKTLSWVIPGSRLLPTVRAGSTEKRLPSRYVGLRDDASWIEQSSLGTFLEDEDDYD